LRQISTKSGKAGAAYVSKFGHQGVDMNEAGEQMLTKWFSSDADHGPTAPAESTDEVPDGLVVAVGAPAAEAHQHPAADPEVTAPSYAVARLLEIATSEAEALVEEAREQADHLVTEARAQAEEISRASMDDAAAREAAMNAREHDQRVQLEVTRIHALQELDARRAEVEERMSQLLDFEGELRTHLTSFFNQNLEMLDRSPVLRLMAAAAAEDEQVG
jgi:vacuolar-type H+-ATPase subunit H